MMKLWLCLLLAVSVSAKKPHHGLPNAEELRVRDLDKIEPAFAQFDGAMYAGLVPARNDISEDDEANLFFWLFQKNTTQKPSDSLVVWFNGGPGCSSIDAGLLFEMGPVTTPLHRAGYDNSKEGNTAPLKYNPYGWFHASDIMYVEQPVGVGYTDSGGRLPENEEEVAADFYQFLKNLYAVFPALHAKRLYLIGESYAGMYVPSMAHYIAQQNQYLSEDEERVNLSGIALGNGWVDAITQGPMVIDYAWWHGMIDTVARDALWNVWEECVKGNQAMPEPFHDFTVPDECGIMPQVLKAAGANEQDGTTPNTYDVTTWDKYAVLTSDDGTFAQFYNNPQVKQALNVGNVEKEWMGCLPGAGRRRRLEWESVMEQEERHVRHSQQSHQGRRHLGPLLDHDTPVSMSQYMADLLDQTDIDVLVYNGDDDLSTCSQGSEIFLNGMIWSGQRDWVDPEKYERGLWKVDGKVAGHAKSVQNLHFLIVYNSGHMVPYNQPTNALDLVTRLTSDQPTNYVDQAIAFDLEEYLPKSSSSPSEIKYSRNRNSSENGGDWTSNVVSGLIGLIAGIGIMWAWAWFHDKRHGYEPV